MCMGKQLTLSFGSINIKDVSYMVGEAWEKVKAESIMKVWNRTLLNGFGAGMLILSVLAPHQ